jgi:hypothetical protein
MLIDANPLQRVPDTFRANFDHTTALSYSQFALSNGHFCPLVLSFELFTAASDFSRKWLCFHDFVNSLHFSTTLALCFQQLVDSFRKNTGGKGYQGR